MSIRRGPNKRRTQTNKRTLPLFLCVLALGMLPASSALAREPGFGEYRAMQESLRTVPPKMRMEWLHERGIDVPHVSPTTADSGSGLKLVSKWGRGPAAEVTGKDTLVVLTLGSEVALLNFANPDSPVVLSEIQFPSITTESHLEDSLLYTSSTSDIEIWNVADPTRPVKRGQLLNAFDWFGAFWLRDTLLFYIAGDTFHVIDVANPADLRELGFCVIDSGSVTAGSGNTVVVTQFGGYAFVDVSNPASPHQVGSYPCGSTFRFSAAARGKLVCASYEESGYPYLRHFITLDISTPSSPRLLANLANLGGYDIFLDGPLAFVSGIGLGVENPQPFQILSIADSAHPAFIDSCRSTNDYPWAVWENSTLNLAFVADRYDGLAVVDINNLNNPTLKTWVLKTGSAWDVHVDGHLCYVAGETDGFRVLDVTDPTQPVFVSGLDTSFTDASNYSLIARDSFAFVGWRRPDLRVVNVADPLHPQMVAACSLGAPPKAMTLRDSLLYLARNNRFQIVNVARPREPVLMGECVLSDWVFGMDMSDTLAFLVFLYDAAANLQVVDVARPDSPEVIGVLPLPYGAAGVAVMDTFAYVVSGNLYIASVADPTSLRLIDSLVLPTFGWSVAASDSLLFIGSDNGQVSGGVDDIRVYDIANPVRPVSRGSLLAPDEVERLTWIEPYLYAACSDAGVLVVETTAVGVQEPRRTPSMRRELLVSPSPAGNLARVQFGELLGIGGRLALYDVTGRLVLAKQIRKEVESTELRLVGLSPGLYFVRVETKTGVLSGKMVKQ